MKSRRPDLDLIFSGGGKPALELLEYCVRTVRMEPVFVFLVSDYRLHPSAGKALALHDVFCAPDIRFRTITWETFRAGSGMLSSTIHSVRTAVLKATAANLAAPQQRLPATLPPRHVFDSLVAELRSQKR